MHQAKFSTTTAAEQQRQLCAYRTGRADRSDAQLVSVIQQKHQSISRPIPLEPLNVRLQVEDRPVGWTGRTHTGATGQKIPNRSSRPVEFPEFCPQCSLLKADRSGRPVEQRVSCYADSPTGRTRLLIDRPVGPTGRTDPVATCAFQALSFKSSGLVG